MKARGAGSEGKGRSVCICSYLGEPHGVLMCTDVGLFTEIWGLRQNFTTYGEQTAII